MYLVWEGAEVATKKGRGKWKCFCGERRDDLAFVRIHLEDSHDITDTYIRSDDENYDGRKI